MKIFITHYSKLLNRKKHIDSELSKHKLEGEFILQYDKENIQEELLDKFNLNKLNKSQISLFLKHLVVYQIIYQKFDYALILEDDVILDINFNEKLNKYFDQFPLNSENKPDWDIIFLGDGCGLHIPKEEIKENQYIYKARTPSHAKCTDSYIITKSCCLKLLQYFNFLIKDCKKQINLPIDIWLNICYGALNLKYFWVEPTIVSQGSQNGLFNSSLN
jgi:glycosyl transferase family 25